MDFFLHFDDGLMQAGVVFITFLSVYLPYGLSLRIAQNSKSRSKVLYLKAVSCCALLAMLVAGAAGVEIRDEAGIFRDGRVPADEEFYTAFWKLFIVFTLSSVEGIRRSRSKYDV